MTLRVMQVVHQGGGAGSVTSTLHLSLGLQAAGLDVRFVCPPGSEVEALAWGGGLAVHPMDLVPGERRANAAVLRALLREHPVDLVNSQSARDRQAFVHLARRGELGVPLVLTRRQIPRTFIVENWIASRAADRVVAVSQAVASALHRRGTPRRKLVVIPNGLVAARVDGAVLPIEVERWRERIAWDTAHRTVGIISRPKDHDVVLRALEQVETPVRLVLAGVPPDHPFAAQARAVPTRHAVVCLPFGPAIRALYELLELVLLPSRMEGLSQSLLEAMALAKPVIASRAGGNLDLIRHEADGLLVAPRDPREWATAIERLLGDAARCAALGAAARRTARETFSLEHTIRRTLDLYRGLVPPGRL